RYLKHFQGPAAGRRFRLAPFQERFVHEFWRRKGNGRRVYSVGLLAIPKGNGKTPLAAGLGTYALLDSPSSPEVFGIAGARAQAKLAQRFVKRNVDRGQLGL